MKYLLNYWKQISLILMVIIIQGCEDSEPIESFESDNKTMNDIDLIKKEYNNLDSNSLTVLENLNVEWDQYSMEKGENGFMSFEFETKNYSEIRSEKVKSNKKQVKAFIYYSLEAHVDEENNVELRVHKYVGSKIGGLKSINYKKLNGFTGNVRVYSDSNSSKLEFYENGKMTTSLLQSMSDSQILLKEPPVSEVIWIPIIVKTYTDWYTDLGYVDGYRVLLYKYATPLSTRIEYVPINTGYIENEIAHSHFDDSEYNGPHGGSSGQDVHVEEIILSSTVNQCVEDVIEELKIKDDHYSVLPSLDGQEVSHLSQQILDLFDSSKKYDIEITVEQLGHDPEGNEINGQTTKHPDRPGWLIRIDSDIVNNGTQLSIAKTIMHEAMHAYINTLLRSEYYQSDLAVAVKELHEQYKNEDDDAFGLAQHEFMGEFNEAFAYSLAAWDNHAQDLSYYKMLSWGGLESSTEYQNQTNPNEIQIAINNERYGYNQAKGEKCP